MRTNKINVKASNSPLGGGSVRVYVGDKLVWVKRVGSLLELDTVDRMVKQLIANKDYVGLRLV